MATRQLRDMGLCSACRRALVWPRTSIGSSPSRTTRLSRSTSTVATGRAPFRMAVVGSGPAGFYTAYRVMTRIAGAKVDMYETLPVPYGLVCFGVAPDHPEVKNCQEKFAEVASSPDFTFIGNMSVGDRDGDGAARPLQRETGSVPLRSLLRQYDAVAFAYGAARDRRLHVPGEADGLRGLWSAREFVGWYNGLPVPVPVAEDNGLGSRLGPGPGPDLARADTAVVIGQGNVALDVARILLRDVEALRGTDMPMHAVEALRASAVRRVHIVGRRGPMQAAFTIKELRELIHLQHEGIGFEPFRRDLMPPDLSVLPRPQRRLMELLANASTTPSQPPHGVARPSKLWSLDFCLAPTRFLPREPSEKNASPELDSVEFARTVLEPSPFDAGARAVLPVAKEGEGDREEENRRERVIMKASLAFRSIGYAAEPLAEFADVGIPFDDRRGVIPNDGMGRVLSRLVRKEQQQQRQSELDPASAGGTKDAADPAGAVAKLPGLYCAGWVKTGPTGVIAATMADAFATADAVASDWAAGRPFLRRAGSGDGGGWAALRREAEDGASALPRGQVAVHWRDWERIDVMERRRGEADGKTREKFTSVSDLLAVARGDGPKDGPGHE